MEIFDVYLEELKLKVAEWNINKSIFNYHEMLAAFDYLICTNTLETQERLDTIISYFPLICLAGNEVKRECSIRVSDKMLTLLKPDVVNKILNLAEGEKVIAWFCCDHAITYYNVSSLKVKLEWATEAPFKDLIKNLTGQELDEATIPTLDIVVSLLYGPACWELYGCDIVNSPDSGIAAEVISSIISSNLPLVFKDKEKVIEYTSIELPGAIL